MVADDYYYELKYVNGDTEVVYRFNALIVQEQMEKRLFNFLRACTWDDKVLKRFRLGESNG